MRPQVALLPQRPVFISGTVADNLRLARTDATDDELWTALRQVALEERVRNMPGALDAAMAEDGQTLSAGARGSPSRGWWSPADRGCCSTSPPHTSIT